MQRLAQTSAVAEHPHQGARDPRAVVSLQHTNHLHSGCQERRDRGQQQRTCPGDQRTRAR